MAKVTKVTTKTGQTRHVAHWRDPDGRLREKWFTNAKAANNHLATATADMLRGVYVDERLLRKTLREVAEEWLVTKTDVKPRTEAEYRRILDKRLLPRFGNRQVGTLKRIDSAAFIRALKAEGLAAKTIERVYGQYKSVLLYALDEGYIVSDKPISKKIKVPKDAIPFEPRFLSVAELDQLAGYAQMFHPDYGVLVRFLGMTGLRVGEAAALTVGDLRLFLDGRAEVRVTKTATSTNSSGPRGTTAPKTPASVRTVTLPPSLAAEMREYMARHPASTGATADTAPRPAPSNAPLWCGRIPGGQYKSDWKPTPSQSKHHSPGLGYRPLHPSLPWDPGVWRKSVWSRMVGMLAFGTQDSTRSAQVRTLRVHDLRHTAASLMLASGMNMQEVSAQLGHADSVITAKVYAHLLPTEVQRSVDRYDAWVTAERERAEAESRNVVPLRGQA